MTFAPGLPHDASVDGHLIDALLRFTTYGVGALFLAGSGWLAYACLRRRDTAVYDRGDSRAAAALTLAAVGALFCAIDGTLLVQSTRALAVAFWNFTGPERDPRVVRIEVNAHQWAWDGRYAGPDGQFNTADDVVTTNDLRVPVGQPVLIQLAASDVLHSFYLPNFRVKQDAVPGTITRVTFTARETGVFEIACAQHCGVGHYRMRGQLMVMPPADYERWLAAHSALSALAHDEHDADAHWGWAWHEAPE
jgi:cytochrome c oxidase subunit 2